MRQILARSAALLAALSLLGAVPALKAAEVEIQGNGFSVFYDDSLTAFYGTPFVLGGTSLIFTPLSNTFSAQSNAPSWTLSGDSFGLRIVANAGYELSSASVVQFGTYSLSGATSQVYAGGETRAVESGSATVTYAPILSTGVAALGAGGGSFSNSWTGLSTQFFSAGADEVQLTIDSLLGARAGLGGSASIAKSSVTLSVVSLVSAVPEASTYAMFGLGLLMLGGIARRRMS